MPSLVSDFTSSAITLSRAASTAARTSSMVAVFFFTEVELYRGSGSLPAGAGEGQGGVMACLDLTNVRVRVLDWGWKCRRLHRRQDQEHRPPGPLARREDD